MYPLTSYRRNIAGNLAGGITAAVVALPLALAFGIGSGAGAVAGLYGAMFTGFFAAVFGGTPVQVSGPTGPMTVVMTAVITSFIGKYPDTGLALAFTTVVLAGCFQVLFGILKLGKYVIMVPYPVISGFMTGIGAIIIILQLGPLLGFAGTGTVAAALVALPAQLETPAMPALITGLLSLLVLFLWRGRINRLIPSPLLVLALATVATRILLEPGTLSRIGPIPGGWPEFYMPVFRADLLREIFVNALMLAVLGAIDSLLTSLVADNISGQRHDSDRELRGQGFGNIAAGLFGGLPGAGATMRTVVNVRAGADGPLSGVTHALILAAVAAGMGVIFEDVPLVALAAILVKVGIDIIDWPFLRRLHRLPLFPVALMLTVLVLTVTVDLITAVFVGVFIKNIVTVSKLSDLQLGAVIVSDGIRDYERLPVADREALLRHNGSALLLRITGPVSYAVGRGLNQRLEQFRDYRTLLIDVEHAAIIGISTTIVLEDIIRKARARDVRVRLVGADALAHSELRRLGIVELVGRENSVKTLDDAMATM